MPLRPQPNCQRTPCRPPATCAYWPTRCRIDREHAPGTDGCRRSPYPVNPLTNYFAPTGETLSLPNLPNAVNRPPGFSSRLSDRPATIPRAKKPVNRPPQKIFHLVRAPSGDSPRIRPSRAPARTRGPWFSLKEPQYPYYIGGTELSKHPKCRILRAAGPACLFSRDIAVSTPHLPAQRLCGHVHSNALRALCLHLRACYPGLLTTM